MNAEVEHPRLANWGLRGILIDLHKDLLRIDADTFAHKFTTSSSLSYVEKMIVLLEDRRFFTHNGVDWISVLREFFMALLLRRHGGASTIDMQLVRTLTGYKQRSLKRKVYEATLATIIQIRYSKLTILRSYIASAYFGSHLKGADKAAMAVYGKASNALNLSEAAFIAAMLVYPRPLAAPEAWRVRTLKRANYGMTLHVRYKKRFD